MTSEGMEKIGLYDDVYIVTMIYTLSGILIREINVRNILITTMLNQIFNEDCLEGMKRIPDGSIDLTVTSPPYDNLRTYNGYSWDFE